MDKDILAEVIAAEREIQHALEEEELRAKEWLGTTGAEISREAIDEERRLRDACGQRCAEAERAAADRAARIVKDAESDAMRLRAIADEELGRIAGRHLERILPV